MAYTLYWLRWLKLELIFPNWFFETCSETLNENSAGWQGYCLVQRIEPVRMSRSGAHVRLTLRASSASSLSDIWIDRITISQANPAGKKWDSISDLTAAITIPFHFPANASVPLPAVNYSHSKDVPLLIAIDFSTTKASAIGCNKAVPIEEACAYYKPPAAEAMQLTRS
jgi:hypothetical protein